MGTSGERPGRPYALRAGEGWTYRLREPEADQGADLGIYRVDFSVKLGELRQGRRLAVFELDTRRGEEPPDHTHPTEDEVFYVLQGDLTFRCGDETFDVEDGGFVFLPRGVEHGYRIRTDRTAHLLVVTAPGPADATPGWDGFVGGFECDSELRGSPPP